MAKMTSNSIFFYEWMDRVAVPDEPTEENVKPLLLMMVMDWVEPPATRSRYSWLDEQVRHILGYHSAKWAVGVPR